MKKAMKKVVAAPAAPKAMKKAMKAEAMNKWVVERMSCPSPLSMNLDEGKHFEGMVCFCKPQRWLCRKTYMHCHASFICRAIAIICEPICWMGSLSHHEQCQKHMLKPVCLFVIHLFLCACCFRSVSNTCCKQLCMLCSQYKQPFDLFWSSTKVPLIRHFCEFAVLVHSSLWFPKCCPFVIHLFRVCVCVLFQRPTTTQRGLHLLNLLPW